MNSIHDMGGMHGLGPIVIEQDEPVFHDRWHGRVFALRMACAFHRKWNADMGRYARERMPALEFLAASTTRTLACTLWKRCSSNPGWSVPTNWRRGVRQPR